MKEGKYVFCTDDGTVILHEAWESLRRPGMTLNIQLVGIGIPSGWPGFVSNPQRRIPPKIIRPTNIGPSGNLPSANTTTSDSSSAYTCASPTMKQIHGEMEELLRLSDSWSPDPDTIGTGLGRLLGLWTNALDPHVNVTEDSESEWTCSTGDSDYSSGSMSS